MDIGVYRKSFLDLSEDELSFLKDEFSVDNDWINNATEKDLNELYDNLGFVEADEIVEAGNDPLSPRGKLVCSIVTKIGELFRVHEDGIDDDWD